MVLQDINDKFGEYCEGKKSIVSLDGGGVRRMSGWRSCRTFESCGTAQRSEKSCGTAKKSEKL